MSGSKYEINEKGQILADPEDLASEAAGDRFSRYNGGWVKRITGIDKSLTSGYSLLGDFKKGGKTWNTPGAYIDCSIDGSRKRQERRFTLFMLRKDGSVKKYGPEWKYQGSSGGDWAVEYWPSISEILADPSLLDPELQAKEPELPEAPQDEPEPQGEAQTEQLESYPQELEKLKERTKELYYLVSLDYFLSGFEPDKHTNFKEGRLIGVRLVLDFFASNEERNAIETAAAKEAEEMKAKEAK